MKRPPGILLFPQKTCRFMSHNMSLYIICVSGTLIEEATLWQHFLLNLSKDSTVDLLYRAKKSEEFFPTDSTSFCTIEVE